MVDTAPAAEGLFAGKETTVRTIYQRLLDELSAFGPYRVEPKKTSIHLVRTTGFAGLHPRKRVLLLNLWTDHPIDGPRVVKTAQVSKNRYHNEVKLSSPDEVNGQLVGWLRDAYTLGSSEESTRPTGTFPAVDVGQHSVRG